MQNCRHPTATLATRRDDMRARYALILERDDAPDLRQKLTGDFDVSAAARLITTQALAKAGLPNSDTHVDELLSLTDSLVFIRTAMNPAADLHNVLARVSTRCRISLTRALLSG
jgi:hypothetical protein